MGYLREAVEQQKKLLIHQLMNDGAVEYNRAELQKMTIHELLNEYDQFLITTKRSKNNSLKFTRSISVQNRRKPS
ncbi:hypothetical protein [Aquibacillus albus]|uniref:Fur-regulated basic protein FbpA n=1 Tax=Aquibacillus albus TaxID=1168171 RepID=A0ABS2N372_9BACI|nr:hypothetical protein [Aquibacillus albus]MBM7572589.1 hypothetical protein [Aquibacillus albus]